MTKCNDSMQSHQIYTAQTVTKCNDSMQFDVDANVHRDRIKTDIDVIPDKSLLSYCINNLHDSCDNKIQKVYFQKTEVVSISGANCTNFVQTR